MHVLKDPTKNATLVCAATVNDLSHFFHGRAFLYPPLCYCHFVLPLQISVVAQKLVNHELGLLVNILYAH